MYNTITSDEKAELLKETVYQLYSKEGRSKSYISKLLKINRKTISDKISEWELPEAEPQKHLTPSNQKFLNKNRNLIKSRLDNDIPMTKIAEELKISRHTLYKTFIINDDVLKKAHDDYIRRINDNHETHIENMKNISPRQYIDNTDISDENWKPVLGYENYEVSDKGHIRHYAKRYNAYYILRPTPNKYTGRLYVKLSNDNRSQNLALARIVAHAFVNGYSTDKNTVNHIDGNILNNSASNLEWVSQSENNKHAYNMLNRTKVNHKRYNFDRILYKNKYEFKTVAAFARFLNKSESQIRRYMDEPEKHDIEFIKNRND